MRTWEWRETFRFCPETFCGNFTRREVTSVYSADPCVRTEVLIENKVYQAHVGISRSELEPLFRLEFYALACCR